MSRLTLIPSAALLLAGACGAEPPEDGNLPPGPDAGVTVPGERPELSIDQTPATTPYGRLPVSGTGPALGTVIAETLATTVTATIGPDGSFCIDIPLQAGATNTIWFKALDTAGVYSDEIERTVRQEGDPPPTGDNQQPPSSLRNVARFGAITHGGLEEEEGQIGLIVDGDDQSYVRLRNHATAKSHWFSIQLTETAAIDHIRVRSRAECPFPNYTVVATDAASPSPPVYYDFWTNLVYISDGWSEIASVTSGDIDQIIQPNLATHPLARHVAFYWTGGGGCGPTVGTKRNEVVEVEVVTEDEAGAQPPPPEPSCSSGGQ